MRLINYVTIMFITVQLCMQGSPVVRINLMHVMGMLVSSCFNSSEREARGEAWAQEVPVQAFSFQVDTWFCG